MYINRPLDSITAGKNGTRKAKRYNVKRQVQFGRLSASPKENNRNHADGDPSRAIVLNWDQTEQILYLPQFRLWINKDKNSCNDGSQRQIGNCSLFCATKLTIQRDFLLIQLIFEGKTCRCHPNLENCGIRITHS